MGTMDRVRNEILEAENYCKLAKAMITQAANGLVNSTMTGGKGFTHAMKL